MLAVMALAAGACDRSPPPPREAPNGNVVTVDAPTVAATDEPGVTPMAERVAVIGLLNKRNGIVRDLEMRPGQAVRVGDAVVRLRACETAAPWENQPLTGAFLQLDVQRPDGQWQRVFSGWVYRESPSLNVVEHPVYDVWPKSCAMTYPAGPGPSAAPVASNNRSSAPKSAGAAAPPRRPAPAPAPAAEEVPARAVESNSE